MPLNDDPIIVRPTGIHTSTVIWLHGLGADGNDFVPVVPEFHSPFTDGTKFIFPNAPRRPISINGGMVMRGWYDVRAMDLTMEEDRTGIMESARLLEDMLDTEADQVSPGNIILAGFSQGGAMALHTGLRYTHSLAGVLALSCYLPLRDQLDKEANAANRNTPILMMHGIYDPVIPVYTGERSCRFLQDLGYKVDWQQYSMQHAVCPQQIEYIGKWLGERLAA